MKAACSILVAVAVGSLLILPAAVPASAADVVYTKYNIHVQGKADRRGNMAYDASYANWTEPGEGHYVIPPNTAVTVEKGGGKFWEKGFTLIIQDPAKLNPPIGRVFFEYDAGRMKMNADDYVRLITSAQPVSLDGYSAKDREGIKAGEALVGMTRKGVMAALGYPAAHETPSLDADTYVYWRNRLRKKAVDFNADGKVVNVR